MADHCNAVFGDEDFEEDDYGDEDAWTEVDDERPEPAQCLFCELMLKSPEAVFDHSAAEHGFQIQRVVQILGLDCFGYIKMINYIRSQKPSAQAILNVRNSTQVPWDSDRFMHPVNPEDPMLQFDIEDLEMDCTDDSGSRKLLTSDGGSHNQNLDQSNGSEEHHVTMTAEEHKALLLRLQRSEERAKEYEENLQRALQDLKSIREKTRDLMLSQANVSPSDCRVGHHMAGPEGDEEDPYFSSYGHFSIHEEMLKDRVRTESYRDFMYHNCDVFRDKIVLDVGCGTGILSMFAVHAGAKHVYAVDMAEIIYQAMDIARENKLADRITFIKGKLEDIKLPVEKVDIIISEWMGYFLLFESMLDSVLFARAKYLSHEGIVYPDRCTISIAAISDLDLYNKHATFWDDVYGFKMTCMKSCVVREASVEVVSSSSLVTGACIIKDLDICNCGVEDLQFTSDFTLTVNRDCDVTAFIGYFDTFFGKSLSSKVSFSTGPGSTATHWKQTVFLLDTPIHCKQGDVLKGTLSCRKNRKDTRSLIIKINCNDKLYTYYME